LLTIVSSSDAKFCYGSRYSLRLPPASVRLSRAISCWRDAVGKHRTACPKKIELASCIPGLRQNSKILWADDAKIIGDGIAEALPVLGDFVAQEIERGVRKLSACGVAFVVRDVLVHDSP